MIVNHFFLYWNKEMGHGKWKMGKSVIAPLSFPFRCFLTKVSVIFTSLTLLVVSFQGVDASQKIAFLPFKNATKYRGSWDLERNIPREIGKVLSKNPFYPLVPVDSVESVAGRKWKPNTKALSLLGDRSGADIIITGKIKTFSLSRTFAGPPLVGGYTSYTAEVELEATLWRAIDGKKLSDIAGTGRIVSRNLGFSPLAKSLSNDINFIDLSRLTFGSEQFKGTVIGQALDKAITQFKEQFEEIVSPSEITTRFSPEFLPKIISIEGDTVVWVNVGTEDGVELGDKFQIYSPGKELKDPDTGIALGKTDEKLIGTIQIVTLKAEHLSKARIITKFNDIAKDSSIRPDTTDKGVESKQQKLSTKKGG